MVRKDGEIIVLDRLKVCSTGYNVFESIGLINLSGNYEG